ncbi:MAG: hypothetical protein ACYC35_05685 [Pirellulales bacterium]
MISHARTDRDSAARESAPDEKAKHAERPDAEKAVGALGPFLQKLAELVEYASYYLAVQSDLLRRQARVLVLYVLFGLAGALVATVILAAAAVFLIQGVAGGLSALFGGRIWAGELATGVAVPAAAGLAAYLGWKKWMRTSCRSVREKYERRQQAQRARFGRDLHDRVASTRQDVRS